MRPVFAIGVSFETSPVMKVDTARRTQANNTPIGEIMTKNVICVPPELSVEELALMMIERNISGAPVVDGSKKVIGVVSKTDVVRRSIDGDTESVEVPKVRLKNGISYNPGAGYHVETRPAATVYDIMTPVAFTLSESATIAEAAALMAFESAHRIPIVSGSGVILGIVSSIDVLRWIAETDGYLVGRPART